MNWPQLIISFLGNSFLLAALGYYFNRRLKTLEADLKLKGLIRETVYKNSSATIVEARKRLLEYKRVVDAYSMTMSNTDNTEPERAARQHSVDFDNWFNNERVHLRAEHQNDVLTVFHHLQGIHFLKGMVLLHTQMQSKEFAKMEAGNLLRQETQTERMLSDYEAKTKAEIHVS